MRKLTQEEFIARAEKVHGGKFDYSLVRYTGIHNKVKLICRSHGTFWSEPNNHLRTGGCPKCRREKQADTIRYTKEIFIKKAQMIQGDRYDYSGAEYVDSKTKIKILCKSCGEYFLQTPKAHLQGEGCPYCLQEPKGEKAIRYFLETKKITFEQNKRFDDLGDKYNFAKKPSFDFYIPDKNLLIEFNGEQHYEPVKRFGGEKKFKQQQESDLKKRKYAEVKGIRLLTIPFWEFKNIGKILEENIGS